MNGRDPGAGLRVLLVGDYPPPAGGIATHVKQLESFLASRGVTTRVLDVGEGAGSKPGVLRGRPSVRFVRELLRHSLQGWLIHLHTSGNNPKSWILAALSGGRPDRRVVTLHSGRLPEFLAAQETRRWFARVALGGYGRVIAVSEPLRLSLLSAGIAPASIDVLPPFLPSEVRPGAPPIGFEAIRARRRPLLAMAHHPSPVYGREAMFRALALLKSRYPDVGLALFGPGTRSAELREAATRAGVSDSVEDLGELEHPEALGLLAHADVFVRPTRVDGDAISVREALALGTPCVASDACPRPWGTTAFRTDDAEDLVRAIGHALLRGPVRVDSPDVGEKVLGIYQRLWSGSPREAPAPVLGG